MTSTNSRTPIKDWSEDDRPREKFILKGRDSLSDAELLAILLGSGSSDESAVDLAKRILAGVSNNLAQLSKCDIKSLKKYKGVGTVKAVTIAAALELGRRRRESDVIELKQLRTSKETFEYMQTVLADKAYEEFWIINLNNANRIISRVLIGEGGINQATVDIRRIFKAALEHGAASVILCHNHPSGVIRPSGNDVELTNRIKAAGEALNIKVLDHLIVGDEKYYSFADEGGL
jgi:DNA repair protein RadC